MSNKVQVSGFELQVYRKLKVRRNYITMRPIDELQNCKPITENLYLMLTTNDYSLTTS